jgi:propionate CoA-transferase
MNDSVDVRSKCCDVRDAMDLVRDGQTVGCVGVIGWITPDLLLKTLGERFGQTQRPRDLTFYFPCGTGDAMGIPGMDHVAVEGLMKRIVSGSYINPVHPKTGARPRLMQLIQENRIEAYSWPIGASMHWLREVARRGPGYITRIGLGCYIDPEQGGGKYTTKCTDDLVEKITLRGQPWLFYPTWDIDVGLLRATSADEDGNLSFEEEPIISSNIALAMAVKASGGTVIAQVKRIVPRRSRPPHAIRLPGALVDRVVVCPDQPMVTDTPFDGRFLGIEKGRMGDLPKLPLTPHKVIARRAGAEVRKGELSIFGFGASSDAPLVMAGDNLLTDDNLDEYRMTTEHGSFGGVVMSGWQFSANMNVEAIVDGVTQFDLIDGGLCRFAALAFAQFDRRGRVNVSRFGSANPGAGGFIDIAYSAKRLVFTGTLTTGGSKIVCDERDGKAGLRIVQEGSVKKLVEAVDQITYDVAEGVRQRGQEALLITERAVFQIAADGLVLVEIAPGVDLQRDVLDQMSFAPVRIADPLPLMDPRLFCPAPLL